MKGAPAVPHTDHVTVTVSHEEARSAHVTWEANNLMGLCREKAAAFGVAAGVYVPGTHTSDQRTGTATYTFERARADSCR